MSGQHGPYPSADAGEQRGILNEKLTRRRVLALGAQGAVTLGAGSLLAACGSNATASHSAAPSPSGTPVRGGTLTMGMITGGSSETLNPGLAVSFTDFMRMYQVYDWLFVLSSDANSFVPSLAASAEHNKDATVWTIHLRAGVTWHDGKPFTADDVLWTIKSWSSPANIASGVAGQFIDFSKVRKRGPLTVEVPMVRPTADLISILTFGNCAVIQNGATAKTMAAHPVGTGPFQFTSFQPGSQSVFAANPHYWRAPGKPYLAKLVINSTFSDETSRNNALLGGQIQLSPVYPANFAKQQQSGGQVNVLTSPGTEGYSFAMRVDKGPFADVRVRRAMKLLVDRQAMIDSVFSGMGSVGNDLLGVGCPLFASNLTPTHDVEQAKSLLKAAGRQGMTVGLQTGNATPGFVESATLLAQQAKAAGVNIVLDQVSPSAYFTSAGGFLTRYFGENNYVGYDSLTVVAATSYLPKATYDETHWANQAGGGDQALLGQAIGAVDPQKAAELWARQQQQQFSDGGLLIWTNLDWIDAAAKNVHGLSAGKAGPLNNFEVFGAWVA
jgi:peptide/nickel transport system substrate-binding protein